MSFIHKIFKPKTLSFFYTILSFSSYKTERIPSVDKIIIFIFYRFTFFRNKFLKTKFSDFYLKQTISDRFKFDFSKSNLKSFELDGITPVFNLDPNTLTTIIKSLDKHPIEINGKRIILPINKIISLGKEKDFNGLYSYKNISNCPELLEIGTDPALIQFVSKYLRSNFFTMTINAFWSFPNKNQIGNQKDGNYDNAQNYHCDHVARRCVKLFIYLTDCSLENGPHSFIKGTHLKKPFYWQINELRLNELELQNYYEKDDNWLTLIGDAGSAFITDPFGIHKGYEPISGSRLLIQFMFSIDYFSEFNLGTNINASELLNEHAKNKTSLMEM